MKPITKQLINAALVLTLVTVLSLGIRHIRFDIHRANTIENPVIADAEPDHYPADLHTVDVESEPQYANASDSVKETPIDDHSEAKSFKGNDAKSEGSKGLEKVSLGDHEDIYLTGEGQLWYVSEQPDGKSVKMQVQIDDTTGEMTIISIEGSKGLEKVSLSDYENLYITEEGELWYVSEQPDGSSSKMQVLIDDTTGEVTVVDVK